MCCKYFILPELEDIFDINLNIRIPEKNYNNYPKIGTVSFYYRVMGPKDVDGIANSVDLD